MLDNIEQNLLDANDYMEKAEKNLESAQNIHRKNRSKMCYIMICLVIVAIFLVLWLFGLLPF